MAITDTLKRFGFVTVMDVKFTVLENGEVPATPETFEIDSLSISNITQEGPTKTIKGGMHATTQFRYGKEMRLEMEDVVARADVLQHIMGAKVVEDELQITDNFPSALRVDGTTFIIDQETGDKKWVKLIIPEFLPDAIFNLTLEAEGDFGTMEIAGEIVPDKCGRFYAIKEADGEECKDITLDDGQPVPDEGEGGA